MTQPDHELVSALRTLRYDLTAMQAKVSDLLTMAAKLPAPDRASDVECPNCLLMQSGPQALAEHLFHVHRGPEPEHWREEPALDALDNLTDETRQAMADMT